MHMRKTPLPVAACATVSAAPVVPHVVLVRGNARQLMLLAEADGETRRDSPRVLTSSLDCDTR